MDTHLDARPGMSAASLTGRRSCAVATAFPLATQAALEMLRGGGNAVDAAVCAAWALCACEPSASGLGGQTVMLIRRADGRLLAIDGHSRGPAMASVASIGNEQQRSGYRSCTVPTTPATLDYARRKFGVLDRQRVMAPALRIAADGYEVTALQARQIGWVARSLRAQAEAQPFLREGAPLRAGEILRQPALARTLARLSQAGIEDFYRGGIARAIAEDMARNGGLIGLADLEETEPPRETSPLLAQYRGRAIATTLPPSGGPTFATALAVLERLVDGPAMPSDEAWYESIAQATLAAFREREARAAGAASSGGVEEPGDTTHLAVADGEGNVVSLTQSIQSVFGAKVMNPELGFFYNNYLCTCPRTPHPNALGSRCRPRSNAAPLMVLESADTASPPLLTLGAAGSRRILSSMLQVSSRVLDRGSDLADAVAAPRIHALLGRKLWIERPAASDAVLRRLARFGEVRVREEHSYAMGAVQALHLGTDSAPRAAADPRRDGSAHVENPHV